MRLSIGQTSEKTGLSVDTLRYYERIGLLPRIERTQGGQRQYSDENIARLRFIQRAQSMNFSLDEIADLLQLRDSPGDVRHQVRHLTEQKLHAIEARIQELNHLRHELTELIEQCLLSDERCPIIDHMAGETT